MRTILVYALAAAFIAFTFAACGGDDGGSLTTLATSPAASGSTASPAASGGTSTPAASPVEGAVTNAELSGRIVYITTANGNQDIWIMKADSTGAHSLTNTVEAEAYPDFSPDGSKIVFQRGTDVWVMNDDGSDQHMLIANGVDPAWSPDGSEIAFSPMAASELDLAVLDVASGAVRTIVQTTGAVAAYPSWSPDGSKIVFFSTAGSLGLSTVAADGKSAPVPLTTENLLDLYPAWSPDGNHIAFVSPKASHVVVSLVAPDGSGRIEIGDTSWTETYPAWSPNGCCIAFESAREDRIGDVYVMRADGSGTRRLTSTPNVEGDLGIDWAE